MSKIGSPSIQLAANYKHLQNKPTYSLSVTHVLQKIIGISVIHTQSPAVNWLKPQHHMPHKH